MVARVGIEPTTRGFSSRNRSEFRIHVANRYCTECHRLLIGSRDPEAYAFRWLCTQRRRCNVDHGCARQLIDPHLILFGIERI